MNSKGNISKKNNNKKENILLNDDNKNKIKNIVSDDDNNMKKTKNNIIMNCLNDINEISIEEIKKIKEVKGDKDNKEEKGSDQNSFRSHNIENEENNSNNEIKMVNKNKINLKNIINKDINISETKNNEVKTKEQEKENNKNESQILFTPKTKNNNKERDLQQAKEYIFDIIESLLIEEDYYLNKKKYINPHYLENEKSELTPEMRTVAVDWLVLIHHKIFKFKENTLFLTIQIFDRYLSKIDLNTEKTELLLLTSFMLASKHNEIDYVNMQETLQLAQNKFTKEQVIKMESEILNKIDFEILSPTMSEYFTLFASYLNLSESKINHGFYVLNIVLVDFHMLEYPNFMLALAVVKLITKKINKKLIKMIKNILKEKNLDIFLEYFEGEDYEEILDICSKIKLLYNTFLETKYKNIQEKFAESKYSCVSTYTNI